MPPRPDRWKERSRTYEGVAQAMADQWGIGVMPEVTWQPLLLESATGYRL